MLTQYPEQRRDRIGMSIGGLLALAFALCMWLLDAAWLFWLAGAAGVLLIGSAFLLSRRALEWLRDHIHLLA